MRTRSFLHLLSLLVCTSALHHSHAATQPTWKTKLPEAVKWQQITSAGTLLVGTSSSLASLDPDSGTVLWTRNELSKTSPFNVREIPNSPILIVNDHSSTMNPKTKLAALDVLSGTTLWETEKEQGYPIGAFPITAKNLLLAFSNGYIEGEGAGLFMTARELSSGKKLWRVKYAGVNDVVLHPSDNSGKFFVTTDLSGHAEPVVDGDNVLLPFTGAASYNLQTGAKNWAHEFRAVPREFKRAAAGIVVDGDTVFASGVSKVVAINKSTGTIRWESKKVFSGTTVQLLPAGEKLLVRLGGNFLETSKREWKLEKPLRILALNKSDGSEVWEYTNLSDGLTNLQLVDDKTVMVADAHNLIGIDLASSGKAKESFSVPLEFKRKLGGGEAAAKIGLGLLGGVQGLATGIAKSASGKDRLDVPVNISKLDGNKVVVRGKQHLLAFDTSSKSIAWSTYYPAPGAAGWEMGLMIALTAAQGLNYNSSYASGQMSLSSASDNISKALDQFDKFQNKRYSATKTGTQQVYILTRVEEGKDKGVGLMAIDLSTGDSAGQVLLKDKEPDYAVDDVSGRLFYVNGKSEIQAFKLK